MKYTIIINQLALQEIAPNLDLLDAAILDYIIHFCSADDTRVRKITMEEGGESKRYTWINLAQLIRELPMLKIKTKGPISRRINKLEIANFIKTTREPGKSRAGRLFIRLTGKIKELYFEKKRVVLKQRKGCSKTTKGLFYNNIQHSNNKHTSEASPQKKLSFGNGEPNLKEENPTPSEFEASSTSKETPKALIDFFFEACKNIKGWAPEISGAAEGGMLKIKLERYSYDDLEEELDWFLNSEESDKLGCTIKLALSNYVFNKWLAQREIS